MKESSSEKRISMQSRVLSEDTRPWRPLGRKELSMQSNMKSRELVQGTMFYHVEEKKSLSIKCFSKFHKLKCFRYSGSQSVKTTTIGTDHTCRLDNLFRAISPSRLDNFFRAIYNNKFQGKFYIIINLIFTEGCFQN